MFLFCLYFCNNFLLIPRNVYLIKLLGLNYFLVKHFFLNFATSFLLLFFCFLRSLCLLVMKVIFLLFGIMINVALFGEDFKSIQLPIVIVVQFKFLLKYYILKKKYLTVFLTNTVNVVK